MELFQAKRVVPWYAPMLLNPTRMHEHPFMVAHEISHEDKRRSPQKRLNNSLRWFKRFCKKNHLIPIGFMPWKLMRSDIIEEARDPAWLETIQGPVSETLELLRQFNAADDPVQSYRERFPLEDEEDLKMMSKFSLASGAPDIEINDA